MIHAAAFVSAGTIACSPKSLRQGRGAKIVRVQARGVSCSKALSVARKVAHQVATSGSVNVPGVAGFSMSTESCTGCRTTTVVSLDYASGGKVTISLRGAGRLAPEPVTPAPSPSLTI